MQERDAQGTPFFVMFGGDFGHAGAAGIGQGSDGPLVVFLRVKTDNSLRPKGFDIFPNLRRGVRPCGGDAAGEAVAEFRGKLRGREFGHAREKAVRRHDDQAGVFHRHEHHQRSVRRMGGREETGVVNLLLVLARGFVAMMAVGDEQRLRTEQTGQGVDEICVGHRPEAMRYAEMIFTHDGRLAFDRLI